MKKKIKTIGQKDIFNALIKEGCTKDEAAEIVRDCVLRGKERIYKNITVTYTSGHIWNIKKSV